MKPRSHNIPVLNQDFTSRTNTPSQSEIFRSGPAHPPKEKYSLSVPKLVIRRTGDTAYNSYIAETLIPLRSAFKPRKQTRFESNPVTSVRHIPARCRLQTPTPRWTMDPLDTDLLIPIELLQATMGECVQDLGENEAGEGYDTSIAHTPPSQPCGQFQAQRSDNTNHDSIAHCRTNTPSKREIFPFRTDTPSQSEIFSQATHNNSHNNHFRTNTSSQSEIFSETSNSSYTTETGMSTDIHEEFSTPSQSESKVTSSTSNSETSRTTTSSQSEIFTETATEYDASSEASSRETSRPSSPETGNLTVRSVYSPLPEMAILHKTMHDAIHTVRD